MKTTLVTTILAISGILTAQTPAFVSDWEGAPDMMKIRNNNAEYNTLISGDKNIAETTLSSEKVAKKEENTAIVEEKEPEHLLGKR